MNVRSPARVLVVNGDDFGRSRGINRGILEAHDHGILTSASLMTLWPSSADAAEQALKRSRLSVGLHVDLGEWFFDGNEWRCTYARAPLDDAGAVRAEVARQLRAFRNLLGRDPSHLDSHQHVHRDEPVTSVVRELADELGVPLRHFAPEIRYSGAFFGQTRRGEPDRSAVSAEALVEILLALPEGITELCCHPGYATDVRSAYLVEREQEVWSLRDPRVRATIELAGIALRPFTMLGDHLRGGEARRPVPTAA